MPRKPSRLRLSKSQPHTFSSFGRSIARVASTSNVKPQLQNSRRSRKDDKDGHHHASENENEQPLSSDDEELDNGSEHLSSDDEESDEGVIQADFAFFDPKPDDFHGLKVLLQAYIDDKQWDLSGFVDLILGQTTVGTVVKIEGDEDDTPYSIVTALNLKRYKDHRCIKELREFLINRCDDKDVLTKMTSLLGEHSQNLGLLVSQRVVNLPPQLLPPLYDALFDEVLWATEDEPTEELRKSFCFKHYLLVTRIYENASKKLMDASSGSEEPVIYNKPEDEIFHKLSLWSSRFPLCSQQLPPHELRNYRLVGLVMALEADKVPAFRQQLHSLIDES